MFTRNTQSSKTDSKTASPPTNDLIRDSGSLEMSEIGLRMIFILYKTLVVKRIELISPPTILNSKDVFCTDITHNALTGSYI